MDQWDCSNVSIKPSIGPKGFILEAQFNLLFDDMAAYVAIFWGQKLGLSKKIEPRLSGDPIQQLGLNLCICSSTVRFDRSTLYILELNQASNIKFLGPIDNPIKTFEQSYWFILIVVELGQQLGLNIN